MDEYIEDNPVRILSIYRIDNERDDNFLNERDSFILTFLG